jgi:hypothetical protein
VPRDTAAGRLGAGVQPSARAERVALPVSPVTVAGIAGTLYTVPADRKSHEQGDDKWTTDDTSADTQIALENGRSRR